MKVFVSLLIVLSILAFTTSLKVCQKTPKWRLNGQTFPYDFHGKVKFVAFLRATCGFCQVQAGRLAELQQELMNEGKDKISFVIVNPAAEADYKKLAEFKNQTSIDILQDTEAMNVWDLYNGITDDMFIFDACDRMVKHLTLPDSDIKKGLVKAEIINAYENRLCSLRCRMNSYNRRKTSLAFEPTASTTLSTTEATTESTTVSTSFSKTKSITENNQETLKSEEAIVSNSTSTDEEILEYDLFLSNSTDMSYE